MDEPKSLDSLFKEKIFRIPDYQRGYAWQKSQLKDFWEDLINLSDNRSHYVGVLTLREVTSQEIRKTDNEYWLTEDHSYGMYHIVDGQQRLTTFIIFLQAFIDFIKELDENAKKLDKDIFITDSLVLETVINRYLFKINPTGAQSRTYKFGYTTDNPSYEYLRYKIFNEDGAPSIKETFYTLNLRNSKIYFCEQLKMLYADFGMDGLRDIYKKLTKKFLFNEYVIKDEFNVFVAFETMNNRGKKLSDLELLKNRLIYLTTLYTNEELDLAGRSSLRGAVNSAWKEVYHQLGRNDKQPLNDDDFLKAHWIMYFQYSRKRGNDYIKFLLNEKFTPHSIYKKVEHKVILELPEEKLTDFEIDDSDDESSDEAKEKAIEMRAVLKPKEIKKYVNSLKESSGYWFNSYYPDMAKGMQNDEKDALDRLNRIGMGYFRPLVMSVLKNENEVKKRISFLDSVERFIFIVFRLCQSRSNTGSSEFYNAAREFNKGEITLEGIESKLTTLSSFCFNGGNILNANKFHNYLDDKFNTGKKNGFYGWNGLHYLLYEYELELLSQSRQKKVNWDDLFKTSKDKISIEHVFPQTPTEDWKKAFSNISEEKYSFYSGSIGNLLLLSMSINSSLQNDSFDEKKNPKFDNTGGKVRNGYSDGSHSEIEISNQNAWTPETIEQRGLTLLSYMEKRWKFKFESEEVKKSLLFLYV